MITDLLPRYYETHATNGTYEIIRSIMIDGHEIAWMKYSATIEVDMMGLGREGQPVEDYRLHCECHFTEGVGWQTDKRFGVVSLRGGDGCLRQRTAVYLRRLELNEEYRNQYANETSIMGLYDKIDDILADLIKRDKRHEFIGEDGGGAHFWGGHFYLDTLAAVIGHDQRSILPQISRMIAEKKLSLEGFVVQEYRKPPRASWSKDFTHERDGYQVVAYLPGHSKMKQRWRLRLIGSDRKVIRTEYLDMAHAPIFGPDVDDVAQAKEKANMMIDEALSPNP